MQLLGTPTVMDLADLRVRPRGLIELLVFLGAEPRPVHNLARGFVGRREARQVREPFVTNGGLQHLPYGHDLIVNGAARRWLAS